MKILNVDLGERSYPIYIGRGLLGNGELIKPHIPGKQVLIVSNETIAPLYLEKAQAANAVTCLYKPFDPAEAASLVNKIAKKSHRAGKINEGK